MTRTGEGPNATPRAGRRIGSVARLLLALAATAISEGASADGDERRMLGDAEALDYRGVGRLNIAGARFCTATMISDRLILTAAHCLFHPVTLRPVPLDALRFVAGLRRDAEAAVRDVVRAATLPGHVIGAEADYAQVRLDLALLELAEPVLDAAAAAFPVAPWDADGALAIVSYARDRAHVASIQEACPVRATADGVAVLDCPVTFGASGAPVLRTRDGETRLIAVVSAMGRDLEGDDVALSVIAAPRLEALQAALDDGAAGWPHAD